MGLGLWKWYEARAAATLSVARSAFEAVAAADGDGLRGWLADRVAFDLNGVTTLVGPDAVVRAVSETGAVMPSGHGVVCGVAAWGSVAVADLEREVQGAEGRVVLVRERLALRVRRRRVVWLRSSPRGVWSDPVPPTTHELWETTHDG